MKGLSPWAISTMAEFENAIQIGKTIIGSTIFKVLQTTGSVWISVSRGSNDPIYFSPCPIETGGITGIRSKIQDSAFHINLVTMIGIIEIDINTG